MTRRKRITLTTLAAGLGLALSAWTLVGFMRDGLAEYRAHVIEDAKRIENDQRRDDRLDVLERIMMQEHPDYVYDVYPTLVRQR